MNILLVQTVDRTINQLQQNIKQAVEPPFLNKNGTFTTTLTGCTTTPSATISWEAGVDGRLVALVMPKLTGTSNTSAATLTGLPTAIWPKSTQVLLVPVTDNNSTQLGTLSISPQGTIILGLGASSGAFTASSIKGIQACTIVYARGN